MANASTFATKEWSLIKDAASWVYAAVSAADTRGEKATLRNLRELNGYKNAVKAFETRSELIKSIIAAGGDSPDVIKDASLNEALENLAKINDLLEKKVDRSEGDDVREFLMEIGQATAEAASEKMLGIGSKVSDEEAAALEKVRNALKATAEHKRARVDAALAKQKEEAAQVAKSREGEKLKTKAKKELDDKRKEAEEARAKVREEAAAKREAAERKARAEQNRAEAAAKIAAAQKALADKAAAEAAAKAAVVEAAEAAKAAQWLGEYTVVSGDNLSFIAKKFYGSATNWKAIYEANKGVIGDNPNIIRVGQVFKIPNLDNN